MMPGTLWGMTPTPSRCRGALVGNKPNETFPKETSGRVKLLHGRKQKISDAPEWNQNLEYMSQTLHGTPIDADIEPPKPPQLIGMAHMECLGLEVWWSGIEGFGCRSLVAFRFVLPLGLRWVLVALGLGLRSSVAQPCVAPAPGRATFSMWMEMTGGPSGWAMATTGAACKVPGRWGAHRGEMGCALRDGDKRRRPPQIPRLKSCVYGIRTPQGPLLLLCIRRPFWHYV